MRCRVCESSNVILVSEYAPYDDFKTVVYDCMECEARFVPYVPHAHENLHSNRSSYNRHDIDANYAAKVIKDNNLKKLKAYLERSPANKYVIDHIEKLPKSANILEMGCSKGYLTGYFISIGRKVLGVDISKTAITLAKERFGNYFCTSESPAIIAGAPYDVVYHVGTIGCVEAPHEFTMELLGLLKPGGVLLFNAPNREYIDKTESLWLSTPPPDLVTLFAPSYWLKTFESIALAKVDVHLASRIKSAKLRFNEKKNKSREVNKICSFSSVKVNYKDKFVYLFYLLAFTLRKRLPSEYGVLVKLKKF